MTVDEKLELFEQQIQCGTVVYTWYYDAEGQLLRSNCPDEAVLGAAFALFGCKEDMYAHSDKTCGPVVLGSPLGDTWYADFQRDGDTIQRAIVLGPIMITSVPRSEIEKLVRKMRIDDALVMSLTAQQELLRAIDRIPVVTKAVATQYALMLHYCLTGEKASVSDLVISGQNVISPKTGMIQKKDRYKVWICEQGLMRMVREGDLNNKTAYDNSSGVSDGVAITSNDPLRQAKTSVNVFTSLCVRAAIEGGLTPEVAYSLGDAYIQSVENAKTIAEVSAISVPMYDDFIRRVHNCRVNPGLSKPIQICCDYIEQNAEGDLNIGILSQRVGYADYYLSRKFKEEVKTSLNNYIKIVRVERAKFYLGCTDESIQDIADRLKFCSRSYFGEAFRSIVGCSPVEYRQKYRKG